MKKIILFFGFLALTMGVACKKDKAEDAVPIDNGAIEILDSNKISGRLMVSDTILIQQDTILVPIDTMVKAEFYDINNSNDLTPVNAVSVNGTSVPFSPIYLGYLSSLPGNTVIPATWNVAGSSIIPDFTYTNLKGMPEYLNYKLLPSIIDCSKDFVFSLAGFKNTRYALVSIVASSPSGGGHGIVFGSPVGDSKSLTYTSKALTELLPYPDAIFDIRIENINYQTLGSRTFGFVNEIVFIKKIKLK